MEAFVERVLRLITVFHKDFISQDYTSFDQPLISISELWALEYLAGHEEVTMKELSAAVFLQTSSTTSLVDRLLKRGYVQRKRCEGDRRVILVKATQTGKALWTQIAKAKKSNLTKLFQTLTESERAQYLEILEKIANNIEEQPHDEN